MAKTNSANPFNFQALAEQWGAPVVARKDVGKFSGGVLHPRTMANLDSLGEGPQRFYFGRKVAYPVDALVCWMRERFRAGGAR